MAHSSIAITTPARKMTYTVGDPLDITGLQMNRWAQTAARAKELKTSPRHPFGSNVDNNKIVAIIIFNI